MKRLQYAYRPRYKARTQGTLFRQLGPTRAATLTVLATLFALAFLAPATLFLDTYHNNHGKPTPASTTKVATINNNSPIATNRMSDETITACLDSINRFLNSQSGSPLKGKGEIFLSSAISLEDKTKLGGDPCQAAKLAIAIACVESSCGKKPAAKYNYWGLKDYTGKKTWESFTSLNSAIHLYIYRTYRPYLHQGVEHFLTKGMYRYCQSACTYYQQSIIYFINRME